jgi:hypothetical protein
MGPTWFTRVQTNSNGFKYDSNDFKSVQTSFDPNMTLTRSKIEIKYGFEGFEERNNFLHKYFFRFELDFE